MNVSNLLDRAAELNEDGVYELADGNFQQAVSSFEESVRHMMQVCQLTCSHSSCSTNHECDHKQLDTTVSVNSLPPARSSVEIPFRNDERFYIYSCTVTFQAPPPASSSSTPHPSELSFYGATILFNLALAHHQQAQKLPASTQRDASYRQALVLYQEVTRTLNGCINHNAPHCRDDILLLALAAGNNQAQILVALQDMDPSLCFQQLLSHSMAALHSQNNFSIFEQSQINEFIRNAMVFGATQHAVGGGEVAAACA